MNKIGLWGVVRNGVNDGYGYAGFKMVETLERLGVAVYWQDEEAPVSLSFIQPNLYGGTLNQYRIGYTPWESTILPEGWAEIINTSVHEFWTTSEFCKDVFASQGVTLPIKVVHHGIDANDWVPNRHKFSKPFIFLHQGEPAERKGSQLVFDAFKEVFGKDNDDVWLVFKSSSSWVEARNKNETGNILGPVDEYPHVQTVKGVYSQEQLVELYKNAHCMVYPSNGEGFGLIPLQAAASGLPTIATGWSGMKDYEDFIIPLDYTVGPSMHGYHTGDWAWPSFDDLCTTMESVYLDYEDWAEWQWNRVPEIQEKFSWDRIFEPIVKDLAGQFV